MSNNINIPVRDVLIPTNSKRIVNFRISNRALKESFDEAERKMVKLTKNPKLAEQFAQALIDSAYKITPYKDEYELKKRKKVVRGKSTKYINDYYKQGRTEVYDKSDWDGYYYKHELGKPTKAFLTKTPHDLTSEEMVDSVKTDIKGLKQLNAKISNVEITGRTEEERQKMLALKDKLLRENDEKLAGAKDELKTYRNWKKDETYVADRPPHLRDNGYTYAYEGGKVGIVYSVKKDKDDHFKDNSKEALQDYARKQYYSQDIDWKRFTPGTSSRWLEQALGIDVGPGYKKAAINGEANYRKLLEVFQNSVSNALKK